jgi:hypothetical protein
MSPDPQRTQEQLVEQALADPRVAEAVRAYDAVRPFVPEQHVVTVATTYSTSTRIMSSGTSA